MTTEPDEGLEFVPPRLMAGDYRIHSHVNHELDGQVVHIDETILMLLAMDIANVRAITNDPVTLSKFVKGVQALIHNDYDDSMYGIHAVAKRLQGLAGDLLPGAVANFGEIGLFIASVSLTMLRSAFTTVEQSPEMMAEADARSRLDPSIPPQGF